MPNNWSDQTFPEIRRVRQIGEDYCGPAMVKMLLSFVGVKVKQREIVAAAGMEERIRDHGTTVGDLSRAVEVLAPQIQLWFKPKSGILDIVKVLEEYKYPVGVEWRGYFLPDDVDDEDEEGHFSVVTKVDLINRQIQMVDPFYYAGEDRLMGIREFQLRWWESNEVINPRTGRVEYWIDKQYMLVAAPKTVTWPEQLGMIRAQEWGQRH